MPINQYILFRVDAGLMADTAAATAVTLGGTLVAINDQAEETLIESLLAKDPLAWAVEPRDNARNGPWIGLTQAPGSAEPAGGWGWTNGDAFTYSHWHSGQPDNFINDNRALFWDAVGSIGWADHVNDPVGAGYGAVKTGLAEIAASVHRLIGTAEHDLIWAGDKGNKLIGGLGDDLLYGNGGKDNIVGGGGNDLLDGGVANDSLDGGLGNDTLLGGSGIDLLTGGKGADVFQFTALTDSRPGAVNADVIVDYSKAQGDVIDLAGIDAVPGGTDDAFTVVTGAFTAAGQLRVVASGTDTVIEINTDSDAGVEMSILLKGAYLASDLTFVF